MKISGVWKFLLEKGGKTKFRGGGGLSRKSGVAINHVEIPHDAVEEKNLYVFTFSLLINKCTKVNAQIKYVMISIVIVLTVLI